MFFFKGFPHSFHHFKVSVSKCIRLIQLPQILELISICCRLWKYRFLKATQLAVMSGFHVDILFFSSVKRQEGFRGSYLRVGSSNKRHHFESLQDRTLRGVWNARQLIRLSHVLGAIRLNAMIVHRLCEDMIHWQRLRFTNWGCKKIHGCCRWSNRIAWLKHDGARWIMELLKGAWVSVLYGADRGPLTLFTRWRSSLAWEGLEFQVAILTTNSPPSFLLIMLHFVYSRTI